MKQRWPEIWERNKPGRKPRLLTVGDVAGRLAVSKDTVYRLINSGAIEAIKISGKLIRIPEWALKAYVKGRIVSNMD